MNKTERNEVIYEDRLKGKTFREIALNFNISPSRAGEIFKKYVRFQSRIKEAVVNEEFKITLESKASDMLESLYQIKLISVRSKNALRTLTDHYPDMTVWQLANYPKRDYLKLQNFGNVCYNELISAIENVMGKGYVPETIYEVKINKTKINLRKFLGLNENRFPEFPEDAEIYIEWKEPKTTKKGVK